MRRALFALLISAFLTPTVSARWQQPVEAQFSVLFSLLPDGEANRAQLLAPNDGHHSLKVIRDGDGQFACVADRPGDDRLSVSCFHRSLMQFVLLGRRLSAEDAPEGTFRERQCAAIESGAIEMPERALYLSASGQRRMDGGLPEEVTVYHMFQMPGASAGETGLPEYEPEPGAPFLHNGGTCDAHLMWSSRVKPDWNPAG